MKFIILSLLLSLTSTNYEPLSYGGCKQRCEDKFEECFSSCDMNRFGKLGCEETCRNEDKVCCKDCDGSFK
jgi:hypothetical protein